MGLQERNIVHLTDKEFAIVRQLVKVELLNSNSETVRQICRNMLGTKLTTRPITYRLGRCLSWTSSDKQE